MRGLPQVNLHQGDGVATALGILSEQDKKTRNGEGVLFFIDGDHSYKSVKRELGSIIKKVPKASILLHDTFYQSSSSKYNVGPYEAINNCLKSGPKSYRRIDTATGLPGMTLLYHA